MANILVSLVSDQTVVNFLGAKEYAEQYDDHWFVSTTHMENKEVSQNLESALGLEAGSCKRIIVPDDSYSGILEHLKKEIPLQDGFRFLVNLTGGNKIIAIGVFDFFKRADHCEMFYLPINKNSIRKVWPVSEADKNFPVKTQISLDQYLKAYGLYYSKESLSRSYEEAKGVFEKLRKKNFNWKSVREIREAQQLPHKLDRAYYDGGWFEEYMYGFFKTKLSLTDDAIGLNVKISRTNDLLNNDNEFDVMFIYRNDLYVCECKRSISSYNNKVSEKIDHFLFKLGAITRDFGLTAHSMFATLFDTKTLGEETQETIKRKREILKIEAFFDKSYFENDLLFDLYMKNF